MNITSNNTQTLARIHFKARRTKSSQVKEIFLPSRLLNLTLLFLEQSPFLVNVEYFNKISIFLDGGDFKVKVTTCMKCHERKKKDKSESCLKKCCAACWNKRKTKEKTKKCLEIRGCPPQFRMYWWTVFVSFIFRHCQSFSDKNIDKTSFLFIPDKVLFRPCHYSNKYSPKAIERRLLLPLYVIS